MTIETGYTRLVHRVKSVQPDGFAVLTGTAGLRRRVPGKVEYEQAEEFVPYTAAEMIAQYKKALADTDYAVIKIAEGAAAPQDYAALIEQRQQWREQIACLETPAATEVTAHG